RASPRDEEEQALDGGVHVHGVRARCRGLREAQQSVHDLAAARGLALDELDVALEALALRDGNVELLQAAAQERRLSDDARQRVVELVRDARAELAEGGELGALDELGLGTLELHRL